MSQGSTTRREEDELLKYAYVPSKFQKTYAFRYKGYPDEIPHVFTKDLIGRRTLRGYHEEIEFETQAALEPRRIEKCRNGDWIIIDPEGRTIIATDVGFRNSYVPVTDLVY
jgi:hypothetical protein